MASRFEYVNSFRDGVARLASAKVEQFYRDAYEELEEYRDYVLKHGRPNGGMTLQQVEDMMAQVKGRLDTLSFRLENLSVVSISAVVSAVSSAFGVASIGFTDSVVESIIDGSVYGPDGSWNLSSSIWGDNAKKYSDIYKIVANCMVKGQSVQQAADLLLQYVDPNKLFYWDGPANGHIYSHKVDYNAQRLVRTLTTHAYQKAVVDSTYNDPALAGYRWHANGSRACPICQDRDGTVYSKDQVPWDHPNGMCYIEPVYNQSRQGFDDIIRWVFADEGDMPEMDQFMQKYVDAVLSI